MIIDAISDLHGHYPELEGGDLLIVAGDLTAYHTQEEIDEFDLWLATQRYDKKIFIAGNHDSQLLSEKPRKYLLTKGDSSYERFEYLCDSGTEFDGLKIWGSPWTKTFVGMNPKCKAFTVDTDEELAKKWALIPKDTDILITHCPPRGIMDVVIDRFLGLPVSVGSPSLFERVSKIKPKLHVFGHVHDGHGKKEYDGIMQVNASILSDGYEPLNKPIRVIL